MIPAIVPIAVIAWEYFFGSKKTHATGAPEGKSTSPEQGPGASQALVVGAAAQTVAVGSGQVAAPEAIAAEAAAQDRRRQELVKLFGEALAERALVHKVEKGDTTAFVLVALGEPERRAVEVKPRKAYEYFFYGLDARGAHLLKLTLADGRLAKVEDGTQRAGKSKKAKAGRDKTAEVKVSKKTVVKVSKKTEVKVSRRG
jgi:hypothetical protein